MSSERKTSTIAATALLLAGLCAVFVGQRILGEGHSRDLCTYGGVALLLLAGGLRVAAWVSAAGEVKVVEGRLLSAYAGVGASLVFYALTTETGLKKLHLSGEAANRVPGMLSVLWMAVLLVSLFAILFMELVYLRMPVPESVEQRRVKTALHAGLSLGLAIVFLLSANYVATARDVRKDVSYFRTSQPSGGTRSMLAKLDKPMRAYLFFRPGSDVVGELRPYFAALAQASKKFKYQVQDIALAPELATKFRVRDNGDVLLVQGEAEHQKAEPLHIGNELTEARATLKKLDANFQQTFAKLVRPERVVYLTVGHGERNAPSNEAGPGDRTVVMEEIFRRINLKTHEIGLATGLGSAIPAEAGAILIIGPSERFLPEEVNTLLAYARKGGKLFLMLDPDKDVGLTPLLEGLGLELLPGVVASETYHMAHAYNDSDRTIVFSNHYSSHPVVTTASRHQREVATVFVKAAALTGSQAKVDPKPRVVFPLRSDTAFFRDLNANFARDADEKQETVNLMAAVDFATDDSQKDPAKSAGRAVVIGDGDFITDKVAPNNGNALLFVDSLAWLIGNEDLSAESTSEEDIPIEHTREQDKVWFYATTFAVPAPLLFVGLGVARYRRRRAEKKS